jgi:plastocyanin
MTLVLRMLSLIAVGLLALSCGGPTPTAVSPSPSPPSPSPSPPSVTLRDKRTAEYSGSRPTYVGGAFEPETLTVAPGTTVTWTNTGHNRHSVVSLENLFNSHPECTGGPLDPIADSKCMQVGESFQYTFTEPGLFSYYCYIHADCDDRGCRGMVGRVTVK